VEAFEEHYFACNNCAMTLQRVAAYVDAMRAAARQLWSDTPRRAAFDAGHGSA
jgi:hypothetical protein